MKRYVVVALFAVLLMLTALPSFASHQWSFVSAACDSSSNRVAFAMENEGGSSPGLWIEVYVDGELVTYVELLNDTPPYPDPGTYEFSISNPAFVLGASVRLVGDLGEEQEITVVCSAAATASCPNAVPVEFRVRSIPAGALAYFNADLDSYAGFNLPPGTWYTGSAENGFVEVWIACQAANIFVPAENVVG